MVHLPPADPWDQRTGAHHITDFEVDCTWIHVNESWALVRPTIKLHDGVYSLAKDAEVYRVRSSRGGNSVESPEMSAIAWTKKALSSGGVPVTGLHERNPGHLLEPGTDGRVTFRWWAGVASRYSVAIVRLDGNLQGQARLTLVE